MDNHQKNVKTERARRLGKKQTINQNKQTNKQTNKKQDRDRKGESNDSGTPQRETQVEQTVQNWQNKDLNFCSVSSVTFGMDQGHQNRRESAEADGSYDRTEF